LNPLALLPAAVTLVSGLLCIVLVALKLDPSIAIISCSILTLVVVALVSLQLDSAQRRAQKPTLTLLQEMTSICQAALEGDYGARLSSNEAADDELALASKTVNVLLDTYAYAQKNLQARHHELEKLYDQMEQLAYEIKPTMDGDLRARSNVTEGIPGNIAAICNALIEDTAQLVQWTQYMSSQIIQTTHRLMGHSMDIAQVVEDLVRQHTSTTSTIEALVAFTQRMESTLFSNTEVFQENWAHLQRSQPLLNSNTPLPTSSTIARAQAINALSELRTDMPRQIRLMGDLLQNTHEAISNAEGTLEDLYGFEKRFYNINGTVAQFANMISALATLANNWRQAAENYALPQPEESNANLVEADTFLSASAGLFN
jgi:hypothetical protein